MAWKLLRWPTLADQISLRKMSFPDSRQTFMLRNLVAGMQRFICVICHNFERVCLFWGAYSTSGVLEA